MDGKSQWDIKHPSVSVVPEDKLKRFEELKQRKKVICGNSTAKRVGEIQQKATEAVLSDFYGSGVLKEVGYDKPSDKRSRKRKRRRKADNSVSCSTSCSTDNVAEETEWQQLKRYLDPNPQLKGSLKEHTHPKSRLEERLEDAISDGRLDKASELSDTLANREFITKVAGAFDCKQYIDRMNEEDDRRRRLKKQKLHWRFDAKERWETKSNM